MKRKIILGFSLMLGMAFSGCASVQSPVLGALYTNVRASEPGIASRDSETKTYTHAGTASCTSLLGLFAWGDCSLETAKHNGEISLVHHVDYKVKSFLGIVSKYSLIVYGE